jgi:hypothetical protein
MGAGRRLPSRLQYLGPYRIAASNILPANEGVTDAARTRDLRSHKSNEARPARPSVSIKVLICRHFVRREIQYRPLHTDLYQPGCSRSTGFSLCWDEAVGVGQGVYEAGVCTHSSAPRSPESFCWSESTLVTEMSCRFRSRTLASTPCKAAWSAMYPESSASPFGSFRVGVLLL